jgi:hypothetical protein
MSARLTGRLGIMGTDDEFGFQRGLTPRWDIEVKFERSDSAGLRDPWGISS